MSKPVPNSVSKVFGPFLSFHLPIRARSRMQCRAAKVQFSSGMGRKKLMSKVPSGVSLEMDDFFALSGKAF